MTFVQDVREKTALGSERRVIALAILSILILSVLLVFGAILIGASNLNATALRTSRSLATTVFAREAAALTRLTADNSWWDIARENLVGELDPVWADDNIGSYMHDTFDVTSVFVLDVEGDLIIAFHEGEQTDQDPDELMGPTLRNFALTHNQSTADQAPPCRSGIYYRIEL